MTAPAEVSELVERFARNLDVYKRTEYKEANVRVEFIDPFFKALGWDVRNVQGHAEQYKEVVHEDALKVSGGTRAPDYCFRVGGVRKFFLEAKKPSVSVRGDVGPAYQLRRYTWSAKLPLGILTDFEEFAVYDCRQRPKPGEGASVGRVMYLTFDQYPDRFDEIYAVFGKESVWQGSFDRYVQDTKRKRGTSEVDAEFLKEIEGWRDALARNIALRNPALSVYELNYAVQRTIDRIIFLRMCEDRGVEEYGRLLGLTGGTDTYAQMGDLYRQADEKYNSDLFDFQADTLSRSLVIDDKVLQPILAGLYYPQSPYEFSVLPADVLGQVYEQFLGKVIRLTPGHRAKVEEKPEVRKAGGVYYTPTYIVDYIVKQTVGKLIEGQSPRQISELRIVDPACGSGSFLLGAYQYLLDYHLQWYESHDPAKHAGGKRPVLRQGRQGNWRLTTAEKKQILLNNIYGVDIDRQAVEVTKLSLLLKVLEGESEETLGQQLTLWRERALPDLGDNIKCGNSLIGPDYYEGQQLVLFDDKERRRVNAFEWATEFPEIMAAGGFDAVIGNPPYTLIGSDRPEEQTYFTSGRYSMTAYKINSYILFLEKGLRLLGPTGSMLGFIIPKSLVFNTFFERTRFDLLSNYAIPQIVEIRERVFSNAVVGDSILFFGRKSNNPTRNVLSYFTVTNVFPQFAVLEQRDTLQAELLQNPEAAFYPPAIQIRIQTEPLNNIAIVSNGLNPGNVRHILLSASKETDKHQKMVLGRDIRRFMISWSGTWVNYDTDLKSRIKVTDTKSKKGMTAQKRVDFALRKPRIYAPPKLLVRKTSDHIIASYDPDGFYFDSLAYGLQLRPNINESILYILGLLNSRFLGYFHDSLSLNKDKAFAKVLAKNLDKLPIRTINFDNPADVARHDKMVTLVECMLELRKELAAATIPADKKLYQRQIEATDRRIDTLVYELYLLTDEEIAMVEGHQAS